MHADTILLLLLACLAASAVPIYAWFRAQKRIRHLEMTLLSQASDADNYEELRSLLQNLALQTEQLADTQALLARRIAERPDPLPRLRAEGDRPNTPH